MFAPSAELVRRYAETIVSAADPRHRATQELIRDYVLEEFHRRTRTASARSLAPRLSRAGRDREKVHHVVGHIVHERTSGETIRDTFGDYITDETGKVTYFEPGVLAAFEPEAQSNEI